MGHGVASSQVWAISLAWVRFHKRVIIPVALLFGALTFSRNAAITMRLSSTLSERSRLEEAVILPTIARQIDRNDTIHNETPRLVNAQQETNQTAMYRLANTNTTTWHFPRTINMADAGTNPHITTDDERKRRIHIDKLTLRAWKHIDDDINYPNLQESPSLEECIPMSSWQTYSFPNCNSLHELDLYAKVRSQDFYYVASGGYNDVFRVHNRHSSTGLNPGLALKLLSPTKKHRAGIPIGPEYSHDNYDIVRRDALILERLTKSTHVLPLYGYCGFAVVVPFADGGTLASALPSKRSRGDKWGNLSSSTRLTYAMDAAKGLADIHDIGVVHADLTIKQYMIRNGTLQLGDFNRGILLRRNSTAPDTACTFQMTNNYGTTRAPEEYMHKPQTSSVDVWSLGSLLFNLLTGNKVWSRHKKNKAQEAVIQGLLPEIDKTILNSSDPVDKLLKKALDICYVYDPSKRSTARLVASFLQEGWEELSGEAN
mmetsp:Transcript_12909/g.22719  ORF Transcript_12909/g.22719 Transcript_12909/m.22719 type:complete len:486 (+) Transcript_12909:34-1491(+)